MPVSLQYFPSLVPPRFFLSSLLPLLTFLLSFLLSLPANMEKHNTGACLCDCIQNEVITLPDFIEHVFPVSLFMGEGHQDSALRLPLGRES